MLFIIIIIQGSLGAGYHLKKIDEVKYTNVVMKNNAENYDQGPHES